jgi:CheY-specific phosphatase CheX
MASAKAAVIAFAGDDSIEWEPLIDDAVVEIGNVVVVTLKRKLERGDVPVKLSVPAVYREPHVTRLDAGPGVSIHHYRFLDNKLKIQPTFNVGIETSDQAERPAQ